MPVFQFHIGPNQFCNHLFYAIKRAPKIADLLIDDLSQLFDIYQNKLIECIWECEPDLLKSHSISNNGIFSIGWLPSAINRHNWNGWVNIYVHSWVQIFFIHLLLCKKMKEFWSLVFLQLEKIFKMFQFPVIFVGFKSA